MTSVEHQFITQEFNRVLVTFAKTGLLGVIEAERRKFDYSCLLLRDFSRPLVSQVLWKHEEGIDKDLRTLLHDTEATIKLYFVRDSVRNRLRIDEVIHDYRISDSTRHLLLGLKLIFLPDDFDADQEKHRDFMATYLTDVVTRDLLFAIVFGQLTGREFQIFVTHGGPHGLKYAALDQISITGLIHGPTFKQQLGYKTTGPIREVTTMLAATGLVRRLGDSTILLPSFKGRMLLDLTRRLLLEYVRAPSWSTEVQLIFRYLGINAQWPSSEEIESGVRSSNLVGTLLRDAIWCKKQFGRDLLAKVDLANPKLYTEFDWKEYYDRARLNPNLKPEWFSEESSLYFVNAE